MRKADDPCLISCAKKATTIVAKAIEALLAADDCLSLLVR
jgi:hypothetical protein